MAERAGTAIRGGIFLGEGRGGGSRPTRCPGALPPGAQTPPSCMG
ncbi:hypothetical protein HMPREF0731_3042 [Pseudoroseomonas cervicalis ATCC 49957]|uniref:Uncharacterized protein n=1 Tax=Pseudoroseomonas cervicalis ATCC 49957 TaxID=525371 RepID=D5RPN0_9PROT|nr:hypothetical protein HMPREF0731_3042 [Pseudoroseomonas cervicalis ATCC 49957]